MPRPATSSAYRGLAVAVLAVTFSTPTLRNLGGGWGVGAVIVTCLVATLVVAIGMRPQLRWSRTPHSLLAFLALSALALLWLPHSDTSAIGVVTQLATAFAGGALALALSAREVITALGRSLRIVVGTQAALLASGSLQGIAGHQDALGFFAVLALVIVALERVSGTLGRRWSMLWIVLCAALALRPSDSGTVVLCLVTVTVTAAFALWIRILRDDARGPTYLIVAALVITLTTRVISSGADGSWRSALSLGRGWSDEGIAGRSPVLAEDAWFPLAVVGVLLLAAVAVSTLWRSWFRAIDRPRVHPRITLPYSAASLMPLLVVVTLLTRSLAEGRIPTTGEGILLVIVAVHIKQPRTDVADEPSAERDC
ncbi:hypothetical protein E2R33_02730 [Rathayibacter toxicus]|uniref:hypothetical protein n=1 Tax=Rathayibacter toxicus TaxID=145458 RepID=UPI001C059DB5|nr:hypothetical protein [Rathayibacter toxicus]QWL27638.1 hypothetical protein E2R33_02730 [Rathayibacter toxicus]